MPPDLRSSKQAFDISLLDVGALDSPDGLNTALRSVATACFQADPAIAGMVAALNSRSHVLEYIFSGTLRVSAARSEFPGSIVLSLVLDEKAYQRLSTWIISGFPTPTTTNVTDTLSMKLLQRLSSSLLFAEYPSAADAPPDLSVFWRKVELSFELLRDLEAGVKGSRTGEATSPISRKKGKTVARGGPVDPFRFDPLGINVPNTETEARQAHARVLSELQSILEVCGFVANIPHMVLNQSQYYLLVLRQPLVSEIFKSSYAKVYLVEETRAKGEVPAPETETAIKSNRPAGPAFPMIQPMKASLYFEGIEGFGEWAILLSTRALKDLRDVRRSDGAMFRIVMKKIKYE